MCLIRTGVVRASFLLRPRYCTTSSMVGAPTAPIIPLIPRDLSSRVRLLSVTHVSPEDRGTTTNTPQKASAPHANNNSVVKLNFFDLLYITMAPVQKVLFYQGSNLPPFPSIKQSLRSSLAVTLAAFPPFSRKLTYRPSSRDVVIDSSPAMVSPGVKFVEAEHCGPVDLREIAGDDEHHLEVFTQLLPEVGPAGKLPAPVFAVQVTRPAAGNGNGGDDAVAVGVSMHHSVGDGRSFWRFMTAWAAAAREGSLVAAPGFVQPNFDREGIRDPRVHELTRKSMNAFATKAPVDPFPFPPADIARQRRRTFWLGLEEIQSLKQRLSQRASGMVNPPSTFVALSTLVWTSIVRAKPMDHADDCYLLLSAHIRRRLRPAVEEDYFGNCVMGCLARATVADLSCQGDEGLARAALAIQKAAREGVEDPIAGVQNCLALRNGLPADRVTVLGSSNQFRPYEADFGWGAPRAEMVSMTVMEEVALRGAPNGGVQVSMALDRTYMDAVVSNFSQALE